MIFDDSRKAAALLLAVVSLVSVFVVAGFSGDVKAVDSYWSYQINSDGTVTGDYSAIGPGSSYTGSYTSVNNTNVGSWGFDDSGYGPFGSFYAAFDPAQNNLMICHLDPDNLKVSVDGKTDISGKGYNIMWCLPTVYWKSGENGSLILTNDPDAGGIAYAHTIDGDVYPFLAIGVYEGSKTTINGTEILASLSGGTPLVSQTRAQMRDLANNQSVNTDGNGINGHAGLWNFYQYELYKYCALAVMGSWDSQSVAGNGSVYGTNSSVYYDTPGLLDASGPYAGTLDRKSVV